VTRTRDGSGIMVEYAIRAGPADDREAGGDQADGMVTSPNFVGRAREPILLCESKMDIGSPLVPEVTG
jgi:hypothetical protein